MCRVVSFTLRIVKVEVDVCNQMLARGDNGNTFGTLT